MEHKTVTSRKSGRDGWVIKCSCGKTWHGWRWLCEERFMEHSSDLNTPFEDITQEPEYHEYIDENGDKHWSIRDEFGLRTDEFPYGEFEGEYRARQGDLSHVY